MDENELILSIDFSKRHGVGVIWKNMKPKLLISFKDDGEGVIYDNIEGFINMLNHNMVDFILREEDTSLFIKHIFIEEPLGRGPNQGTIVELFFVLGQLSYALYSSQYVGKTIPIFLHQSKVKTYITRSQPRKVDKKALVEKKMLEQYPDFFEKLPDKRKTGKGDTIYDRKYKILISDCADSLAVGLYGINEISKENAKVFSF